MHCCHHQEAQKLVFPFEFVEERNIMEMYLPNGDKRLILSNDDAAGCVYFFSDQTFCSHIYSFASSTVHTLIHCLFVLVPTRPGQKKCLSTF